ncbi:MAG: DUF4178 domain-containing protein [Kofleriaceae bacterium]
MFVFLFVLLTVLGAAAAGGMIVTERRRRLGAGAATPARALPSGDALVERTVAELRVGDVVILDGRDFLCEGTVGYDEAGHRWLGARVVDAADVRWLYVGVERTGGHGMVRLMTVDDSREVSGHPAETIVLGSVRYLQDRRGTATCKLSGDVGGLGGSQAGRPADHAERCRWWLYNAVGDDTLFVEQWGSDLRVLRGHKIAESTIELIPGS